MENKIKDDHHFKPATQISILDIIMIFLKWKKHILILTVVIMVISVILYFFVFDLIYTSSASIKSSGKTSGLMSSIDVGIGDLGGLDDIGLGGSKSAKELAGFEEILSSRRCIEPLIKKFGLMERDDFRFVEDAIKSFREEKLLLKQEKMAGVLYVSVLDKDPKSAKEMVEFLLKELNDINIELNVQNAKNNREFIEQRYFKAKEDLTSAEDSLKSFQMIYGVAPDLQIKAAAQSMYGMEAELKAEEIKLDVIRTILSPEQPEVKIQEAKVNSLRDKISGIRNSTDLNDILNLGNSPLVSMSYLRLQREIEIQTKILTFILPIYEQAKIEEKRETPTIIVLDSPVISERKTKPKRLTMVIIVTFGGFIFSCMCFISYEKILSIKSDFKRSQI